MPANPAERKKLKIIVGSSDSCDLTIHDSKVSKNHCELAWIEGAWHVRDLSSTNGTFVDGRKISQQTRLTPESIVTLGRNLRLEIPPDPDCNDRKHEHLEATIAPKAQTSVSKSPLKPLAIGGSVVALVVIAIIVGLWLKPSSSNSNEETLQANQAASSDSKGAASSAQSGESTGKQTNPDVAPQSSETVKASPFWAIIAVSGRDQSKRLVGNAVAVSPNRLVTLASITEALEELKNQYPKLVLAQHSSSKQLSPRNIKYHPKYQPALESLKNFEKELNTRLEKIGNQSEPSLEESLDWSSKLDTIMEELASVELATMECDETLPSYLSIANSGSLLPKSALTLEGYPMILPTPSVDQNLKTFLISGNAAVLEGREKNDAKFMIETSDFSGFPFLSLACIKDSQLLGIVVRQPQVEGIGSKQIGKLVRVEEFWK